MIVAPHSAQSLAAFHWGREVHCVFRQSEHRFHAIENGGLDHLQEITRAVASLGGLAYTARLAQSEADQALAALAPLPETAFKEGLSELAKFAVARKN